MLPMRGGIAGMRRMHSRGGPLWRIHGLRHGRLAVLGHWGLLLLLVVVLLLGHGGLLLVLVVLLLGHGGGVIVHWLGCINGLLWEGRLLENHGGAPYNTTTCWT